MRFIYNIFISFIVILIYTSAFAQKNIKFDWDYDNAEKEKIVGFKLYEQDSGHNELEVLVDTQNNLNTFTTYMQTKIGMRCYTVRAYSNETDSLPSDEICVYVHKNLGAPNQMVSRPHN